VQSKAKTQVNGLELADSDLNFQQSCVKRALDNPEWSVEEPNSQTFSAAQRVSKSKGKFSYFYSIASSSVKPRVVSSVPTACGTVFLRIRGIRCLQSRGRFKTFPSVIPRGFLVLFSKEAEEGRGDREESNTIDFFKK